MLIEQVRAWLAGVLPKEEAPSRRRRATGANPAENGPLPLGIAIAGALAALGELIVALKSAQKAAKKRHAGKAPARSSAKRRRRR